MRMWDAALLSAKKSGYVTDGLVVGIDFLDPVTVTEKHDGWNERGIITNRGSGSNLRITSNSLWDASFTQQDGFLVLQQQAGGYGSKKWITTSADVSDCKTLECVYADDTSNDPGASSGWKPRFAGLGAYYERGEIRDTAEVLYRNQPYAIYGNIYNTSTVLHICFRIRYDSALNQNRAEILVNGTRMLDGRALLTAFPIDNNSIRIFESFKESAPNQILPSLPLRVGSIRLYNRALTDEEIAQNVQYEVKVGRLTV